MRTDVWRRVALYYSAALVVTEATDLCSVCKSATRGQGVYDGDHDDGGLDDDGADDGGDDDGGPDFDFGMTMMLAMQLMMMAIQLCEDGGFTKLHKAHTRFENGAKQTPFDPGLFQATLYLPAQCPTKPQERKEPWQTNKVLSWKIL